MLEYISFLVTSHADVEKFANTFKFDLGEKDFIPSAKSDVITLPFGDTVLYFLIPHSQSDLADRIVQGNHIYSIGIRINEELVEIKGQIDIHKEGKLLDYHLQSNRSNRKLNNPFIKKIDHVLFVTNSLAMIEEKFISELNIRPNKEHSFWYFPDFNVTDMTYKLGNAFLEFNEPHQKEGFFGNYLKNNGEGFLALALEAHDLDETVAQMKKEGVPIGDTMPVRAVSPLTKQEEIIERSATLSLKSTIGLRVLISDMSWL